MSVQTHIIEKPNPKLTAILKEMRRRKVAMEKYLKKNKSLRGLEEATGIKFIR